MSSPDQQQRLLALRETIADIERKPALAEARARVEHRPGEFPVLAGGLLQEVFTDELRNGGASLGFALAQARGLLTAQRLAVIYLQLSDEAQKLGMPYGPGLLSFGFDPDALVLVRTANVAELLWAAEEAIACRAVAAVVADIGSHAKLLDFTASRRLSLRSAATGGSIFLLRYGQGREASAAHLRWHLSPARSAHQRYDAKAPGPLRWRVELEKGAIIKNQTEFVLGWTENGFATFTAQHRGTDRRIGSEALPRAIPAQLADGLSQTA
jgi:protein ImuA